MLSVFIKKYRRSRELYIIMTAFCGLMLMNSLVNGDWTYNRRGVYAVVYGALTLVFYRLYLKKKEEKHD